MRTVGKISVVIGGVATLGVCTYMALVGKKPDKYSPEWIKGLSDKDWKREREIIRQMFCNPKYSISERSMFQKILDLFDKVKSDRDWAGVKPYGPTYNREHGNNLYKP